MNILFSYLSLWVWMNIFKNFKISVVKLSSMSVLGEIMLYANLMQISHMAILLLFMRILVVFVFQWSVLWSYLHYHWDKAFNLLSSEDIIVVGDISLQLGGSNYIMDDILLSTIFISMVILLFGTLFRSFFWNPPYPFMK